MRRRYVAVLFQHRLFGEALARALGENDRLEITTIALREFSPQALDAMQPDAIVVEGPMTEDIATLLLGVAAALTVVVGPETNTAEVYERHEVIVGTAAEIGARIMATSGPKRATTARRRAAMGDEEAR